ncbi:CGNR zinc finger domain-containing protein [Streptomyces sp. NPDC001985]|uniref:CGNR zinc finger domain-containing protein n=1 Tax=Streptomyces sp. NPDC001985 TaxID=3154406 RepID=UPI003322BC0F
MPVQTQTSSPVDVPPLNGEPLPIEFVNTVYPVRGELLDVFRSPEHLAWWLRACGDRLSAPLSERALAEIGTADLRCFTLLRDASRRLIDAFVGQGEHDPWDVENVNRAAGMDRPWPLLRWSPGERPSVVNICTTPPLVAVQAEIAHAVVRLLAGASGADPRPCPAPGCVFLFDRARSRREWCSTGCGNRARAARHYARHHGRHHGEHCS